MTSSSDTFTVGTGANLTAGSGLLVTGGTLAGPGTVTGNVSYTSSSNSSFAGQIAGTGNALTLDAAGSKLTLTGNSSYTGGTSVVAGTLLVSNTTGSGTGTGDVSVASGATLAVQERLLAPSQSTERCHLGLVLNHWTLEAASASPTIQPYSTNWTV